MRLQHYNMDFLFAALILLLIVLYHFIKQKKLDSTSVRIFRFFIVVGIADILLDILSTLLIAKENAELTTLTVLVLTAFYLIQVAVPVSIIYYAYTLRNEGLSRQKKEMWIWFVIPVVMASLVIANCWNGIFFYFDSQGRYCQGSWYLLMYYYAILYAAGLALVTAVYRRQLGMRNVMTLWEFLLIEVICTAVQAADNSLLMTGFGLSLGITILYLTIGNPIAYIDQLTGVFSKQYFDKWYREQLPSGKPVHIISVAVTGMKRVNKVFGNSLGDSLLIALAKKLQQIGRPLEIFRIADTKFFLVVHTLADYEHCRQEVLNLLSGGFDLSGEKINPAAVICGIVNCQTLKADQLLSYTEYMKSLAASGTEITLIQSSEKIMDGFLYEQDVERFLAEAIEKDLLEVHYQPIYSIEKEGYVSLEALSRLRHPVLGAVPPDMFITLAEKSGQISDLGLLQFRRICRFISGHPSMMEKVGSVKFNLSPLQLLTKGYSRQLLNIIEEYQLPRSFFQFEITETTATEYSEVLTGAVNEFLSNQIGLCLDDFGSGYANINAVLKMPFSVIKLDRSLLSGICEDDQSARFYHSLVSVLQDMGYQLIAEGAETAEEVEKLRGWGVDMIQGYYFSRPLCEADLLQLLAER